MTRLDFAIWRPGPPAKRGYGGITQRSLSEIEGEVDHSTEGSLTAAFGELDRPDRQASWHFTIDHDGTAYQHYELEDITWHCGLPGDRRTDTSLIGNLTLIGIEHVDRKNGVQYPELTPAQLATSVRITAAIRQLCPRVAAHPPALRRNLFEHGWLSATACPSGLIPWTAKLAALEEDDEMCQILTEPWTDSRGRQTTRLDYLLLIASVLDDGRMGMIFGGDGHEATGKQTLLELMRAIVREEITAATADGGHRHGGGDG
jgi:hypothetical protein